MTFVRTTLAPNGWILYHPSFVRTHRDLMTELVEALPLRQETLRIGGRRVQTPRLVSWHGDAEATYSYSGSTFEPKPWPWQVEPLRTHLGLHVGEFNSMLVNYYRDGSHSVGFHADDEPELGPAAPDDVLIASISLGAPRRFVLKRKDRTDVREFMLGGGDLFVMGGDIQKHWLHGVPKTALPVLPRMNLTFRQVRTGRTDG